MNLEDANKAITAFRHALKGGTVSPETLAERAAICRKCPQNRLATGLSSNISRIMGMLANSRRAPRDLTDRKCGVCGCSLMLLVPAADADLHKDTPQQARKRPGTCWMKK